MALKLSGYVDLPAHARPGGFDHAAIHRRSGHVYVAHTANDSLDVIDCIGDCYIHSIPDLSGVAGALVSDERALVFTSNRGENTIGIFAPDNEAGLVKVCAGVKPNGLAYDPGRNLLLAANVGDPEIAGSCSVSIIDVAKRTASDVPVPGRTRWAVYSARGSAFYVNIMEPPLIAAIDARKPGQVARTLAVPVEGPHGLDIDPANGRLFCACDGKKLVVLTTAGDVLNTVPLSGAPDVVFFNPVLKHLYVAVGDPGVIDIFDTERMRRLATVETEPGAHTLALDVARSKVYAFLPESHRAAVYVDQS